MARGLVNFTASASNQLLITVNKKRDMPLYYYTIMGYGTFGAGTLAWFVSPDRGTTFIAMTDLTDTAVTMTSNKMFNGALCSTGVRSTQLQIYVTLSGATSPNVNALIIDNSN
jgi:hypothetical protein